MFLSQLGEVQVDHLQFAHNSCKQPAILRDDIGYDDCDDNDDHDNVEDDHDE